MVQPPGFEQRDSNCNVLVCKRHTILYGLKQAPQAWFEILKNFLLVQLMFSVSQFDNFLFIKNTSVGTILLLLYVDDIVVIRSNQFDVESAYIDKCRVSFKRSGYSQLCFGNGCAY